MRVDRYESMFLWLAGAMLFLFAIAVAISANGLRIQLPSAAELVAPADVENTAGFNEPGIHEISADRYEVYMTASADADGFRFTPAEIEVPEGSQVTFFIASKDVIHGFKVFDTTINVMVIPGRIAQVSYTFDESGDYQFYCDEYCGTLHHEMTGVIHVTKD
jgi:cytochrome c oxidase subunit II